MASDADRLLLAISNVTIADAKLVLGRGAAIPFFNGARLEKVFPSISGITAVEKIHTKVGRVAEVGARVAPVLK